MWGEDRSGDSSRLKGITRDSFTNKDFVQPGGDLGEIRVLAGFSGQARMQEIIWHATHTVRIVTGAYGVGNDLGAQVYSRIDFELTEVNVDLSVRKVNYGTTKITLSGSPETVTGKLDSLKAIQKSRMDFARAYESDWGIPQH